MQENRSGWPKDTGDRTGEIPDGIGKKPEASVQRDGCLSSYFEWNNAKRDRPDFYDP